MDIEERKRRLKAEIEFAENKLVENLSGTNLLEYIIPSSISSISFPRIPGISLSSPLHTVETLDTISRTVFKPEHVVRKVLKYVTLGLKSYDSLMSTSEQ